MARQKETPEQAARRVRAFELYCTIDAAGERPTIRAIAHSLGVTTTAVRYWRVKDDWDQRLIDRNSEVARAITGVKQNLKALLRNGALEGVRSLIQIIRNKESAADDKIKAAQAVFKMARDADAIKLDLTDDPAVSTPVEFNDDLPGKETPPSSEISSTSISDSAETVDSASISSDSEAPSPTPPEHSLPISSTPDSWPEPPTSPELA